MEREHDGEGTLREGDGEVLRDSDGDRVGVLVALAAREGDGEVLRDSDVDSVGVLVVLDEGEPPTTTPERLAERVRDDDTDDEEVTLELAAGQPKPRVHVGVAEPVTAKREGEPVPLVSDDETLLLADCDEAQARNSIKTRVRCTAAAARMLPEA